MMDLQTSKVDDAVPRPHPVLILGLGNILLRDEGVGVRVVEAMRDVALPAGVELFDGATAGLDLLDVIADRDLVIIVDAVDGPVEPGSVVRLVPEDLAPAASPGLSLHEMGVFETLAVAGQLGAAPKDVVILGVSPENVTCGLDLSPRIAGLVPRIVERVLHELEVKLGVEAGTKPATTFAGDGK